MEVAHVRCGPFRDAVEVGGLPVEEVTLAAKPRQVWQLVVATLAGLPWASNSATELVASKAIATTSSGAAPPCATASRTAATAAAHISSADCS